MRRSATAACAVLMLLSGCGGDPPTPADAVPELAETLSSIDDALADHRYAKARGSLKQLVQTTVDAREAGELEPDQADRVLSAAARLLSALPAPRRPVPEEPAEEPPPAEEESEDEWEKKQEEWQKKLEEEQKKLEEERKKLEEKAEKEEEDDDGHDSGNGPDDGHGN